MISATTDIRVRYAETDGMKFVYHGNYLPWFEQARISVLDKIGVPYADMENSGYYLPVLEANLRYHQPAHFDDRVTVKATIKDKPGLRIRVEYEVHRGDTLLTSGYTCHAFIDHQGRPTRPPKGFMDAVRPLWGSTKPA